MNSLVFFDGNGNSLNFSYNNSVDKFSGSLIFPENGSDTFKVLPIYIFEKVPSFEFSDVSLTLDKFQLFNQYGFNFSGGYLTQSVTLIESVIDTINPNIYSKWVYGKGFDNKFKVGSKIRFTNDFIINGITIFYNNTFCFVHELLQILT